MSVEVSLDFSKVIGRIDKGTDFAKAITTESLKKYSDPFTPRDKGNLINDAKIDPKEGTITYDKPYAKRLWYGVDFNFSKDKNPQATFQWCDKAVSNDKKALDTVAQNAFSKGMG